MQNSIITVRIHAGFNADAFLAGLLALTGQTSGTASAFLAKLFPEVEAGIDFGPRSVRSIAGYTARTLVAEGHVHRHLSDIARILDASRLSPEARAICNRVWETLGQAEARVHGTTLDDVHFHEVGRMANILSIGLAAECWVNLGSPRLAASPIPMGDGTVQCAHGAIPYPAPALFAMLDGVPVRPYGGEGEPVTPTGLAVLLGFGAEFGPWPTMTIETRATVFTPREFEDVPNGSLWAWGTELPKEFA